MFIRMPVPPRAIYKGANLFDLTPRGRYLLKRHYERTEKNSVYGPRLRRFKELLALGELGRYENVRFIRTEEM